MVNPTCSETGISKDDNQIRLLAVVCKITKAVAIKTAMVRWTDIFSIHLIRVL